MSKLGSYIDNLMTIVIDRNQRVFVRELALENLKKLNEDIASFIFNHIDEIETLEDGNVKDAEEAYEKFWTCDICGDSTKEVDYDYLSNTDHLSCVLKQEQEASSFPKNYDEDKANERMEIIGQNGPSGEHYDKNQTELEL